MNNKLLIESGKKIKITRIKSWAIYFDYDGNKYLLHESTDDYDTVTTLYKRNPLNNLGKYELEVLVSKNYMSICSVEYLVKRGNGKNHLSVTYKDIDINKFIYDMTWDGFFDSRFNNEIEEKRSAINRNIQKIKELENEIRLLKMLKEKKDETNR